MKTLATRVDRRAVEIKRKAAGEILRRVILGTPVGNPTIWREPGKAPKGYVGGRARANWYVGIGGPPSTETDVVDPSGSARQEEGDAIIRSAGPGAAIHIVNNLPYIVPLNNGHSAQAPIGFIETAVAGGGEVIIASKITEEDRS